MSVRPGTVVEVAGTLVRVARYSNDLACYRVSGVVRDVGPWAARHLIEAAEPIEGEELALREAAERAVVEHEHRVASCHERVACPKCKAYVGVRCVRVGTYEAHGTFPRERALKHPHIERQRADGIAAR